jgi:flagellar basal body-associated protein FliL
MPPLRGKARAELILKKIVRCESGQKEKKMKKILGFVAVAVMVMLALGCATAPAASSGSAAPAQPAAAPAAAPAAGLSGVPQFVNDAYLKASEDVLIGIGTYKIGNDMSKMSMGKTMAETRARADLARQLQSIVKNMITDYTATSELDPSAAASFQESITQALAKADLKGSKTVAMNTQDGLLWLVMEYSKSAAANDYNAAAAAAKLAVPAAAAFDATARMDTAFDKAAGGGPVPVGD